MPSIQILDNFDSLSIDFGDNLIIGRITTQRMHKSENETLMGQSKNISKPLYRNPYTGGLKPMSTNPWSNVFHLDIVQFLVSYEILYQ